MHVRIEDLRHARGDRVVLDVDALEFPGGSTTAVFGPNGAGKSTLLRCIAGLERVRRGSVLLDERESRAREARRDVAFAFQAPIFLHASVAENLGLALALRGVPEDERDLRVADAARECGIAHVLDRAAHRLSAGEAQRANLARTLALRAPLTLLDEPLAGLDRQTREQLLHELPRLLAAFTRTTIMVTHDREEAFRLADRLVVLIDGRVRAQGAKRDVYAAPPDAETARLLGYTVVERGGRDIALAPGALRLGTTGLHRFDFVVERILDLGGELRVAGTIGAARAEAPLEAGSDAPAPGSTVTASAEKVVEL